MKLIKRGQIPGDRIWIGTCHKCGSQYEAKQSELAVTDCQRDGPMAPADCEVCKSRFWMYPSNRYGESQP